MDLYQVLGIARSASADEVERAFRRLARRCHPGIHPGDRAAEEFRLLQEAYRVLGDRDRRLEYDRSGDAASASPDVAATVSFQGFDFSTPAAGPGAATFSELFAGVFQDAARRATTANRGVEVETTLRLAFEDAVRGGRFPVSVVRYTGCSTCSGEGWTTQAPVSCPECHGQGARRWARGHMVFTKSCERCDGGGAITSEACRVCGGAGVEPRADVVAVIVPPGIESGARLAVPGWGHAARGGVPGDLYVTVEVAEHAFFKRAGRDSPLRLPVAVHEAALGARVDVPTLDGLVRLRIPPGTASGQRLSLRGYGVPSSTGQREAGGDLLIEVQIVLPSVRDPRSRELLREFGRLNDVDVRGHLFGN